METVTVKGNGTGDILSQVFGTDSESLYTSLYNQSLHIKHEKAEQQNNVKFWNDNIKYVKFFNQHTMMSIFDWKNYNAWLASQDKV